MTPDEVYAVLVSAGFQVAIVGTTFYISLLTRHVTTAEVEAALGHPDGIRYERVAGVVIVHSKDYP